MDPSISPCAYRCVGYSTPGGHVEAPPVRVTPLEGRGNALVAKEAIRRGDVILTERAGVALQASEQIRACKYCFRSMEPVMEGLPLPHLWPVLPYDGWSEVHGTRKDKYGRRQCTRCDSLFCCVSCCQHFVEDYGSCCALHRILHERIPAICREHRCETQVAVLLAAKVYVHSLMRRHRGDFTNWWIHGLCGDAEDLTPLELGLPDDYQRMTLQPIYDCLIQEYEISSGEQEALSLDYLNRLAAVAGRNGFGITTKSPFKDYYAALLRNSGGRGSEKHFQCMQQVARTINQTNELTRGMDREVDERVAPEICGLFPLIARTNHSCEPNAQVQSQVFVDHHVDMVALTDIAACEEITISYIGTGHGVGKKSLGKRQRELRSKYLFECQCPLCQQGLDSR